MTGTVSADAFAIRAVEVLRRFPTGTGQRWSVGSGYLVAAGLVLTAGHNVGPGESTQLLVRFFDESEAEATVLALGQTPEDDIALLTIAEGGLPVGDFAPVRFAVVDRTATRNVTGCWAVGFPRYKETDGVGSRTPRRRDSEHLEGVIPPGADLRRGLLGLRVTSAPEPVASAGTGRSPWQGISGTLVFAHDAPASSRAIGVITEHHTPEGPSSLTVVPVTRVSAIGVDGVSRVWDLLDVPDPAALPRLPAVPTSQGPYGTAAPGSGARSNLKRFLADFGGRKAELARLSRMLRRSSGRGSTIIVVYGMGGVGKTSIANHLGHLLADDFRHARVFVELGGTGTAVVPVAAAIQQIFDAFGIPESEIPQSPGQREELLQSLYRVGPTLLIIDNATAVDQVEALLPKEPGPTAVIITSRSSLPNLDGVRRVPLRPMERDEALATLAGLIEDEGLLEDRANALRIVELVGGLPLALRLVGALMSGPAMQGRPLSVLARRLEDKDRLLSHLDNEQRGVRASLDISYQTLPDGTAACFRALGLVPGMTFTADLVAAATGADVATADAHITGLLNAQLLETAPQDVDRYRVHDLVRLYARQKAAETDPAPVRDRTVMNIVNWYVEASRISLAPPSSPHRPSPAALAWFGAEDLNVMAVLAAARDAGAWNAVGALAEGLRPLLWYQRRWEELAGTEQGAVDAANHRQDPEAALNALIQLTEARRKSGSPETTVALYERAVEIAHTMGDPSLEGWVLTHYGDMFCDLGRADDALDRYSAAETMFNSSGTAGDLVWLSAHYIDAYRQFGRPEEAVAVAQHTLPLAQSQAEAVWVHWHVALAQADLGRYDEAEQSLLFSVAYHRTISDHAGLAHMLLLLGEVRAEAGRTGPAREALNEALTLAEEVNVPRMVRQITEDLERLREGRPLRSAISHTSDL